MMSRSGLLVASLAATLAAAMASFLFAPPAQATPFFARTYRFPCQVCHNGFPKLNSFGSSFKANGFRIPGAEKDAPLAWETVPLAMQIEPNILQFQPGDSEFTYTDSQLLAGGLLTPRTSFFMHHSLLIDEDASTPFPSYELWIQQILSEHCGLSIKAGQFELPFFYSPMINRPTIFQPIIFGAGLLDNDVRLGSAMSGIQLHGRVTPQLQGFIAVGAPNQLVTGTAVGERQFFGRFRDVFLRAVYGDPSRGAGVFAYLTRPPRDPANRRVKDQGRRFGLDGSLTVQGIQIQGMAVYGQNENPAGDGRKGTLRGAFVEGDYMVRPWVAVNGRLEAQTTDGANGKAYSDAKSASVRFYPASHLRLEVERQFQDHRRRTTGFLAAVSF